MPCQWYCSACSTGHHHPFQTWRCIPARGAADFLPMKNPTSLQTRCRSKPCPPLQATHVPAPAQSITMTSSAHISTITTNSCRTKMLEKRVVRRTAPLITKYTLKAIAHTRYRPRPVSPPHLLQKCRHSSWRLTCKRPNLPRPHRTLPTRTYCCTNMRTRCWRNVCASAGGERKPTSTIAILAVRPHRNPAQHSLVQSTQMLSIFNSSKSRLPS